MEKDNITPEEKLLKIIENPTVEKSKLIADIKKNTIGGVQSLKAWFKGLYQGRKIYNFISIGMIKKAAIGLCVFLTFFLIFDFIKTYANLKKSSDKILSGETVNLKEEKKTSVALETKVNEILTQIRKRNIFTLVSNAGAGAVEPDIALTGNIKLVGIIWSDNPQAMIEDTTQNKTYLLGSGESMDSFTIKKILKDRVIVTKEDKELELK